MAGRSRGTRACPWCGERIRSSAIICRFCGRDATERGVEMARLVAEGKIPPPLPAPLTAQLTGALPPAPGPPLPAPLTAQFTGALPPAPGPPLPAPLTAQLTGALPPAPGPPLPSPPAAEPGSVAPAPGPPLPSPPAAEPGPAAPPAPIAPSLTPGTAPPPSAPSEPTPEKPRPAPEATGIPSSMPANLLDSIIAAGESIDEGERRPITILFSDLCRFAALTEEIGAERMHELLDRVYARVRETVAYYGGIVEKFIGDAVMAVFGAAKAYGDDPERAIRAALDIHAAFGKIGELEGLALHAHTGIAFGEVIFAARGEQGHIDYRSIGEAVNVAARLQDRAGNDEILVDNRVYRQARTIFNWESQGALRLKNIRKSVLAYRVLGVLKKFSHARLGDRISMAPFVGRRAEMEMLTAASRVVAGGQAQAVLIEGDSGIGKSRLIFEFYHQLDPERWHWFTGRCLSYGENTPFFPFRELLRAILRPEERAREDISPAELTQLVEKLLALGAAKSGSDEMRKAWKHHCTLVREAMALLLALPLEGNSLLRMPPRERRVQIFEAAATMVTRISADHPTVLVFEDFQWSDEDSRTLLTHLRATLSGQPVLFLVVARTEPERVGFKQEDFIRIPLKELSAQESQMLLSRLLGIERLPVSLRSLLLQKTEGNPLYMEEIILNLEENGDIERRGAAYRLKRPLAEITIPDSIEGVVLERLDRLEQRVRSVLQCASVIGQEFRQRILSKVAEIGERLREYMLRLVEGGYVLEKTLIPEMVYVFHHVVLREVAYGTLLRAKRRLYHARVGEAIEVLFPDNIEEYVELLAHHYEKGEVLDKAIYYLERAARKCENLYANTAAADFWERLLGCLDKAPQAADGNETLRRGALRLRACLELGELCRTLGNAKRGLASYREARDLAVAQKDPSSAAKAFVGLAEAHRIAGDINRGVECLTEAGRWAQEAADPDLLASCDNMSGHFECMRGNYSEAGRFFQRVLEHPVTPANRKLRYQALNHLGIVDMSQGRLGEAERKFQEAQELAAELNRKAEWVQIELNLGIVDSKRGNCDEALRRYTRAAARAETLEFELGYQLALTALVDLNLKMGEFRRAANLSRKMLERSEAHAFRDVRAVALTNYARALAALGKHDSAGKLLEEARSLAGADGNYIAEIDEHLVKTEILLARGDAGSAKEAAAKALEVIKSKGELDNLSPALVLSARAHLACGETSEALRRAEEALEAARRTGIPRDEGWALWARALCREALGRAGLAQKDRARAGEIARRVSDKALARAAQGE